MAQPNWNPRLKDVLGHDTQEIPMISPRTRNEYKAEVILELKVELKMRRSLKQLKKHLVRQSKLKMVSFKTMAAVITLSHINNLWITCSYLFMKPKFKQAHTNPVSQCLNF